MTVYNGTRKGLNVTVVGNPTINGTVVSGFSKTNYVRTPEPLPTINYLNRFAVQLSVVFTEPSTITEIISGDETTFLLRANKNKLCLFASSNGTSWDIADQVYGTYTLQAGVKYFITVQLENGVVSVLIRAEGEPASTRDISITFTTKKPDLSGKYIYFGWFNRKYFPGLTVDLKDCYYQIRYTTKWRAYDDVPRKIEDIYYSGPKKYWKETPDYSPSFITIDNFIARPSSDQFMSSKVVTKNDFDSVTNMWYVITNYTFDDPNKYTLICNTYNAMYLKANNGYLIMYAKTNSGTVIANDVIGTTLLSSNVEYYFKFGFTGTAYVFYISTDKGKTWTLEKSFSSTLPPRVLTSNNVSFGNWTNRSGYDEYAEGSFDLRGVSIINSETGDTIWKAVKSVEGTKEDHTYSEPDVKQILSIHKPTGNTVGTKPEYALLYNKNISLLKAEDFNSIKESSSGVAIWGGDATSTGSQGGGIQHLNQQDSITFNKSLPAGKYTVTFKYYSQVNFTMRLVQFTATYEDGTTEVVYSNTSLGDTAYGGGEKADVTTTMTFNKRIKGITTLAQGSGGGNGCYGGFGKVRMSLSGAQQ